MSIFALGQFCQGRPVSPIKTHSAFSGRSKLPLLTYSCYHLRIDKALFIKQNCQLQMSVAQYENVATPLTTRGNSTIHQHVQMRYVTLY